MAGVAVAGALYKGRQAKKAAKREKKALLAEALQVEATGRREATVLRRRGVETQSGARAQYGATGVSVNTGSAQQVQTTIGERAEYDALTAILQSKLQAQALRKGGKNVKKAGKEAATSAGIEGAASVASLYS